MLKILGTTDEVNTCDCCGRKNLKDTIALQDDETGEIVYYGCVCAAQKRNVPAKQIRSEAKLADEAKHKAERLAFEKVQKEEDARWQAFLDLKTQSITDWGLNGKNRFRQIEILGGYKTAKEMYKAENNS